MADVEQGVEVPVVSWADGRGWLPSVGAMGEAGAFGGLVVLAGDCLPAEGAVGALDWLRGALVPWAREARGLGWVVCLGVGDRDEVVGRWPGAAYEVLAGGPVKYLGPRAGYPCWRDVELAGGVVRVACWPWVADEQAEDLWSGSFLRQERNLAEYVGGGVGLPWGVDVLVTHCRPAGAGAIPGGSAAVLSGCCRSGARLVLFSGRGEAGEGAMTSSRSGAGSWRWADVGNSGLAEPRFWRGSFVPYRG